MSSPISELEELWDKFLQRWPLESLDRISLRDYTLAGDADCFTYGWLEKTTEKLGSIWGGSAFKFGIYSRKNQSEKDRSSGRSYSTEYGWYSKYGSEPEEAFEQIREIIVAIAYAARAGNLDAIQQADLGSAIKWKIAFLYQDRTAPSILPVYSAEHLAVYLEQQSKRNIAKLQADAMSQRGETNVFTFGQKVWEQSQEKLSAMILKPADVLAFFQEYPERFQPIKSPTKYIAGFTTTEGRNLAIALESKKAQLWMEPGTWLDGVKTQLKDIELYESDRSRNSNLSANAPNLAQGHPAICLTVPTRAALLALCDAYDNNDIFESKPMPADTRNPTSTKSPLNQILYGPPGTGKTYATIDAALDILAPEVLGQERIARKARFDELVNNGKIRFVTFHQSFSYEDFVEGLRASNDEEGQLRYEVVDGVFKQLCISATSRIEQVNEAPKDLKGRRIWKMSLGNTQGPDAVIYEQCLVGNCILLGYGGDIDFSGSKNRQDVIQRFLDAGNTIEKPSSDYGVTSVTAFVTRMQPGDLVVVSDGNFRFRAIGEITGDYVFKPHAQWQNDYSQYRPVKWLRTFSPSQELDALMNVQFSQMTLYELSGTALDLNKLEKLLSPQPSGMRANLFVGQRFGPGYVVKRATPDIVELSKPRGGVLPLPMSVIKQLLQYVREERISIDDIRQRRVFDKVQETELEKYIVNGYEGVLAAVVEVLSTTEDQTISDAKVLIIDEINRGNVSRIFGELITLIEESKRAGAPEALEVVLPYSKKSFSVPSNVYLIGTMNTTDRSLAGLDIALRRRFTFKEMPAQPELLDSLSVAGINIGELLRVMNQRIEVLLDRDHCLGHAYFMPLKDEPTLECLALIFRNQILPLLQEYFFEDWQRIQWVLNDHRKNANDCFVYQDKRDIESLFGKDVNASSNNLPWVINKEAFDRPEAYLRIADHEAQEYEIKTAREAVYPPYLIRQLSSGSIDVLLDGQQQSPAMPHLRKLAEGLNVKDTYEHGGPLNTRELGRRLIIEIEASKP